MTHHHDEITRLLNDLSGLSLEARHDRMFCAVVETGGTWITPAHIGNYSPAHLSEIHLHGLTASGGDDEEAIRNWRRIAGRAIQ